jgi:glycosyltransferase involved in cell wall biosynthesis
MHGLDFQHYLPDSATPVVVSLHLPLSWYERDAFPQSRQKVALVCVSRAQAGTAPQSAVVCGTIPNGVDIETFRPARRKGEYVLLMGRICPEKGIHLALDAAARAGTKLIIAGTVFEYPEHRAYFDTMIAPRLGSDVHFVGKVGGERKAQLLAGARCLLVPSLAPETSSLAAMEAMASGTPVIAWRSGALTGIVAHGRTGFVVSSVEEMADAIGRAASISPSACRYEAEEQFPAERMVSKYVELYHELRTHTIAHELQAA